MVTTVYSTHFFAKEVASHNSQLSHGSLVPQSRVCIELGTRDRCGSNFTLRYENSSCCCNDRLPYLTKACIFFQGACNLVPLNSSVACTTLVEVVVGLLRTLTFLKRLEVACKEVNLISRAKEFYR